MCTPQALAGGTPYVFVDYVRRAPVAALAVVYLVLVVAVAGRRGALSVLGLVLATAVLVFFMIPALLELASPMWVTLVGSMAMMLLAVYVAHGVSVRTTTALLGTVAGVVITVAGSLWGVGAANLTGASDETSVLIGSVSFREGVDVPGEGLTQVIVDRIPFPHPGDPLVRARNELEEGKGFVRVTLPNARMFLRQAVGRLIRSSSDHGRVVGLGTHRELLEASEIYREICLSQLSAEEVAA